MNNEPDRIIIVYDGDCPFCSAYVRMQRLRALSGNVELVNARQPHPVVSEIRDAGLDLDQGMALKLNGELYQGADVVNKLALLTGPGGFMNKVWHGIFKSPVRARTLYPAMRCARNLALRLLNRSRIDT